MRVVVAERPQGIFTRQLLLGDTLDGERVSAVYHDGVLTLTIPVAEQASRARSTSGGPQTVATHADGDQQREPGGATA